MKAKVNCNLLNVRSEKRKDVKTNILGVLKEDDEVEIVKEFKAWVEIKYGDGTAYVMREYIDMI